MDLNWDEIQWIEEEIEDAWDDLRHYPDDHVSDLVSGLYEKVQLAKKQLRDAR